MTPINLSLINRFVSQYYPAQDAAVPTLPTTSVDALEQTYTRLFTVHKPLRDARLSPQDREVLTGKTGPLTTTLLAAAARGLRQCPSFALQIAVGAESVEELFHQRMAVVGDIQVLEVLVRLADHCWYAVSDAAQKDLRQVFAAVERVAGPAATRMPRQFVIGAFFERALRTHRACLQQNRDIAQQAALKRRDAAQPVPQQQDPQKTQQQVQQMLADFAAGKGPPMLLPAQDAQATPRTAALHSQLQ